MSEELVYRCEFAKGIENGGKRERCELRDGCISAEESMCTGFRIIYTKEEYEKKNER